MDPAPLSSKSNGSSQRGSRAPTARPPQDIFRTRGDDRAQSGDYNGAVVMYGKVLSHAPRDATLLLSRSLAHMMAEPPQLDLALKDADAAVQCSPGSWRAWLQKGEVSLKMGGMQGAEEAMAKAVWCAQGVNKLMAQKSLADVRARQACRLLWSRCNTLLRHLHPNTSCEPPIQLAL
jgi:Flp pilus assembly protein TadD